MGSPSSLTPLFIAPLTESLTIADHIWGLWLAAACFKDSHFYLCSISSKDLGISQLPSLNHKFLEML